MQTPSTEYIDVMSDVKSHPNPFQNGFPAVERASAVSADAEMNEILLKEVEKAVPAVGDPDVLLMIVYSQ
jgi:hypothetical protein